jgi:N-acyl-D-amino-acid deacylase
MDKQGMWADPVIFDPETVTDRVTFEAPNQLAEGMRHVLVNGVDAAGGQMRFIIIHR